MKTKKITLFARLFLFFSVSSVFSMQQGMKRNLIKEWEDYRFKTIEEVSDKRNFESFHTTPDTLFVEVVPSEVPYEFANSLSKKAFPFLTTLTRGLITLEPDIQQKNIFFRGNTFMNYIRGTQSQIERSQGLTACLFKNYNLALATGVYVCLKSYDEVFNTNVIVIKTEQNNRNYLTLFEIYPCLKPLCNLMESQSDNSYISMDPKGMIIYHLNPKEKRLTTFKLLENTPGLSIKAEKYNKLKNIVFTFKN